MGRVVNKADYTFNKVAKTITFSSAYTGIELSQIQLITDVTNTTIIYQFNKTGYGGTLAGLVLTLAYNTNTVAFNNADDLMIIINESQDNTQLYSGTLSTTGASTAVLTTDQQTISIQISGTWEGVINVEGSNDGTNYVPLMFYPVNEYALTDFIGQNGIFTLATSTKYVRLNVQQLLTGSITALILGRTVDGPNAGDVLSMAMDRTQRAPLLIEDINGPVKKDVNNATVISDAPSLISFNLSGPGTFGTIDTTGYQSIVVQASSVSGTGIVVTYSNDNITFTVSSQINYPGYTNTSSLVTQMLTTGAIYHIPCLTRYIRFSTTGASGGSMTAHLRSFPVYPFITSLGMPVSIQSNASINIAQVGTAAVGATGANGGNAAGGARQDALLNIGSSVNIPGGGNISYPIMVGGRQAPQTGFSSGIPRWMLVDGDGRVQIATDQTKNTGTVQLQATSNNFQNGNSLNVTDTTQFEGQSQTELLAQILLEMRIMNQYISELPQKLNAGQSNLDEPSQFRNEQSAFNI